MATVNLSEGGLVLYGGIIAGTVAYFVFCAIKRLPPLGVADVITPSVCIGVGFGRIGCLLNGCCFGDRCELRGASSFHTTACRSMLWFSAGFSLLMPCRHRRCIHADLQFD